MEPAPPEQQMSWRRAWIQHPLSSKCPGAKRGSSTPRAANVLEEGMDPVPSEQQTSWSRAWSQHTWPGTLPGWRGWHRHCPSSAAQIPLPRSPPAIRGVSQDVCEQHLPLRCQHLTARKPSPIAPTGLRPTPCPAVVSENGHGQCAWLLRITESQNGRGWQGPLWVTQSNPLLKQGHPEQAAQDLVQASLEYLQRRRLHKLPGQPVPVPRHPQSEEVLPPSKGGQEHKRTGHLSFIWITEVTCSTGTTRPTR